MVDMEKNFDFNIGKSSFEKMPEAKNFLIAHDLLPNMDKVSSEQSKPLEEKKLKSLIESASNAPLLPTTAPRGNFRAELSKMAARIGHGMEAGFKSLATLAGGTLVLLGLRAHARTDKPHLSNEKTALPSQFEKATQSEVDEAMNNMNNANPKYRDDAVQSMMRNNNLVPNNKITVGNATYYCTDPFMNEGKMMAVGLVKTENGIFPRLFYLSDSQGVWRVMPAVQKPGDRLGLFGKGRYENDTNLPFAVNFALHGAMRGSEPKREVPIQPYHVKTAKHFTDTYVEQIKPKEFFPIPEGVKKKDPIEMTEKEKRKFAEEVLRKNRPPSATIGVAKSTVIHRPQSAIVRAAKPADIRLPPDEQRPDYSKKQTYPVHLPKYGTMNAHVVPSKDGTFSYLFYEHPGDRRVFLAAIQQKDSPISMYGNQRDVLRLEGADAPLLEYWDQIGQDYKPGPTASKYDSPDRRYANNWNYIRELPIIQDFYNQQNLTIPEKV